MPDATSTPTTSRSRNWCSTTSSPPRKSPFPRRAPMPPPSSATRARMAARERETSLPWWPPSNCAAHTAELIARSYEGAQLPSNVDGVVAFPHGDGCGHVYGPDVDQLQRTLGGVLVHPNVSAALIVGLGCEINQIDHYLGPNGARTNRLVGMTLQTSGGTTGTLDAARREIARFFDQASAEQRVPCPASKIVLGLNCGGSDSFSGITANPALG